MPSLYVFASTHSSARLNEEAIEAVKHSFGRNTLALNIGNGGQYWTNGFVLRFHSSNPPIKSKAWVTDGLKEIAEFWLMHDGRGNAVDNMSNGPGAMALQKLGSRSVCQLFLRYDPSDEKKAERVERLLADFGKHGVTYKYAHGFNDGRVYFLTSLQTGRTIYRRCEGALRNSIEFVLIDAQETCHGPDGEIDDEIAWTTLKPLQRSFQLSWRA
jgi:hypothetical protein